MEARSFSTKLVLASLAMMAAVLILSKRPSEALPGSASRPAAINQAMGWETAFHHLAVGP
jgi:hypothetical protein